jgi:pyruvyl transferase EpsO
LSLRRLERETLGGLDRAGRLRGAPVVADRVAWPLWHALAGRNMEVGRRSVGEGELLVTDRLHGHILATLCGVPHVVVNDRHGKVQAMWTTWTHSVPGARYAESWDDAVELVPELAP